MLLLCRNTILLKLRIVLVCLLLLQFAVAQIPARQIVNAEYFWDADPGFENGIPLFPIDGNLDEAVESVINNFVLLPPGIGPHQFNLRVQDIGNQWSNLFQAVVFRDSIEQSSRAITITQAEYFWDVDPGQGNGIPMLALDGNLDETIETIYENGIPLPLGSGSHIFNVRILDTDNQWSSVFQTLVYRDSIESSIRPVNVQQAEYFWDTDPGEGTGTPLLALDGNLDESIEAVLGESLSTPLDTGGHVFNIRIKDSDNNWSPLFSTVVYVEQGPQVFIAEYFWDTDPGQGNGTILLALDGNLDETIETLFQDGISLPTALGPHVFNVRAKDNNNQWSSIFQTIVVRDSVETTTRDINIEQAEYFWDTDPGEGSGTPLLALDGNLDETIESVYENGIPMPLLSGPHLFNVRVKDEDDQWGPVFSTLINRDSIEATTRNLQILQAEYFWDTDPGQGAGNPILALDGNLDEAIESLFNDNLSVPLDTGAHVFNVRIKDAENSWGPLFSTVLYVEQGLQVFLAEYFWDTDPGEGYGTLLLALDGNLDETIETLFQDGIPLPASSGPHIFNVRAKDNNNQWSPIFKSIIERDSLETTTRNINVQQAEYFWDVDPGEGSGNPLLALDGNLDETIETVYENGIPLPLGSGSHIFNVRILDAGNQWSGVFQTLVFRDSIESTIRPINVQQAEYFWDTDPGQGAGNPILALDANLDEAIESLFNDNLSVPLDTGAHVFNVRIKDAENSWGPLFSTVLYVEQGLQVFLAEYFWDTDPGEGYGTLLLALDGNLDETIETLFQDGIPLPASSGPHIFNVRAKDNNNQWSPIFKSIIERDSLETTTRNINVQQAEYFWDTDPGQGNGSPLLALDGNLDETIETVFENGIPLPLGAGSHTFNVRILDADNQWSPVFQTLVHRDSVEFNIRPVTVTQAEYFWDTDPGQGNGSPLLALDGNLNETIETVFEYGIPLPLSSGAHIFNVRILDADNQWSPIFQTLVHRDSVESTIRPANIQQAEYFWDTDPGEGNGTPLLALDGSFDGSN